MKYVKFLLVIWLLSTVSSSCNTEYKAHRARRNFMMPEKSDLPRNNKYTPSKKKKTYSVNKKKQKK